MHIAFINSRLLMTDSSQLEGIRKPRTFTELLENHELNFHGVQSSSVLPVLCGSLYLKHPSTAQDIFGLICHLPARCRQQTFDDPVPDLV